MSLLWYVGINMYINKLYTNMYKHGRDKSQCSRWKTHSFLDHFLTSTQPENIQKTMPSWATRQTIAYPSNFNTSKTSSTASSPAFFSSVFRVCKPQRHPLWPAGGTYPVFPYLTGAPPRYKGWNNAWIWSKWGSSAGKAPFLGVVIFWG